jgi:thimet oligopeptidase
MMLEQFVFSPLVLARLSLHHVDRVPLSVSLAAKLSEARHFQHGLKYRRFIALATYDLIIHSGPGPYTYGDQSGLSLGKL